MSWHTIPDFTKQVLSCGHLCPWPPLHIDVLESRKPPKASLEMTFFQTYPVIFFLHTWVPLFLQLQNIFASSDPSHILSLLGSWTSQSHQYKNLDSPKPCLCLFCRSYSFLLCFINIEVCSQLLHCELLKTMYWFFLSPIDCVIMFMLFQTMYS